jgi:tRNA nucleotidyltransferase (CCA-adding enzyme)
MPTSRRIETDLAAAVSGAISDLNRLREAAAGTPLYLVGGAVRDLLLGRSPENLDIAVAGDAVAVARRLGNDVIEHERFLTAETTLGAMEVDLTSTRTESYPVPGALPEVKPASLHEDLARRDFTVNAIAWPLQGDPELIDPHSGRSDLGAGLLRVMHERSFVDDPTRALRAARYAARLELELEPRTAELLREADLGSVSADRRAAELLKLASEPAAARGLQLAAEWGLVRPRHGAAELLPAVDALLAQSPWDEVAARPRAMLVAALGPPGREAELAVAAPSRPSEAVELARDARPEELVLARAMGGAWLDDYVREWREVTLEIDGSDLTSAGVPEGPAVGRGLGKALRRKLDGEISGRDEELRVALEAAEERGTRNGEPEDDDGVA